MNRPVGLPTAMNTLFYRLCSGERTIPTSLPPPPPDLGSWSRNCFKRSMICRFKVSNDEVGHSTDIKFGDSPVIQILGSLQVELVLFQGTDIREVTSSNVSIFRTTLHQQRLKPLQVVDAQRRKEESHVHSEVGPHEVPCCSWRCQTCASVCVSLWFNTNGYGGFLKHLMTAEALWANRASINLVSGVIRQLCPTVRLVWCIHVRFSTEVVFGVE